MGVYIYTLRAVKSPVYVDGLRKPSNHMQYAYKVSGSGQYGGSDYGLKYQLVKNNTERLAYRAFEGYEGGYVVHTDWDGKLYEGAAVYRDIDSPIWEDTLDHPGELVGHLKRVGGKWHVETESS